MCALRQLSTVYTAQHVKEFPGVCSEDVACDYDRHQSFHIDALDGSLAPLEMPKESTETPRNLQLVCKISSIPRPKGMEVCSICLLFKEVPVQRFAGPNMYAM